MRWSVFWLCFLCSACVFHEDYPDDWPAVPVGIAECPDISGTYEDAALYVPNYGSPELSQYFLKERLRAVDARITISQTNDHSIQVTGHGAKNSSQAHTLLRGSSDYSCKDGKIWISGGGAWLAEFGAAPPGVGGERTRMGFAKAADGSLVGEGRFVAAGVVFLIIPVAASGTDYFLWRAAEVN